MGSEIATKAAVGVLYLVGAFLLLPGFIWIIPEQILHIPVHFGPTGIPDAYIYAPKFSDKYETAIHILIWGISLILGAAILDLLAHHCKAPSGESRVPAAALIRVFGPIAQVLGALCILLGCVAFLPRYSMPPNHAPPVKFNGVSATDLANDLFKMGSVLYFIGAVAGVVGISAAAQKAKAAGRSLCPLTLPLPAFCLFMCTSVCYFVNGMLPAEKGIEAGQLRLAGTICMVVAVVILTVSTVLEIAAGPSSSRQVAGDCSTGLAAQDHANDA